ncbi:tRNA epoxyqueuosine(34) reductase QueG [Rhodothermus profundi]|uniref:Epoxyqueuosine reductase n=1 Tax=Rhodothermus profundi TaxID=633813 RepID=A0A1M6VXQ5_9BACT|nr:tRNA epoxyqueuosine(34) reductase QueG [Rhodothermus profundi]SHK86168.1 epoxyqueuosine reductase [Rhodothermus profundi]
MPGFDQHAQERLARALKAEARRLGFDACGISKAEVLDEEARRLEAWLKAGFHGTMHWMERHFDKRIDPTKLVEGARSVISVLHNYYQPLSPDPSPETGKISRYAWGDDYHEVLKEKLYQLFAWLEAQVGEVHGRAFVDSAPVMDKAWARRSGLGWIGKNTNLINRRMGSFFFIGELIVDVPLPPDGPIPDYCGSCTRCLDACPTGALVQPYVLDARRCISYLTIEHRGDDIPPELQEKMGNWIFGCDICQDVCPWNKFKYATNEPRFLPRPGLPDTPLDRWEELDLEAFRQKFRKSAVKRAKFEGFKRNVRIALQNVRRTMLHTSE